MSQGLEQAVLTRIARILGMRSQVLETSSIEERLLGELERLQREKKAILEKYSAHGVRDSRSLERLVEEGVIDSDDVRDDLALLTYIEFLESSLKSKLSLVRGDLGEAGRPGQQAAVKEE